MSRRSFKGDVSFLEKISAGAIGTSRVFDDLKKKGHFPIELERGSMSFKIWKKIKIKRVRVPDILCVKCGKRVESRAKTDLQVTMSHSISDPERGWDAGLNDNDFIAFVKCTKSGDHPIDWKADELVQYVNVKTMREALRNNSVLIEKPKGATEGFEARLTWPSAIAKADGLVTSIDRDCWRSSEKIRKLIYILRHAPSVSRATLTSFKPCMALTLQMKVSLKHPGAHDNISVTQARNRTSLRPIRHLSKSPHFAKGYSFVLPL